MSSEQLSVNFEHAVSDVLPALEGTGLAADWAALSETCSRGIYGPDATSGAMWVEAVTRTHLQDKDVKVHVQRLSSMLTGIIPAYSESGWMGGLPMRQLHLATEAYSGRAELLFRDREAFRAGLEALLKRQPAWDVFMFSMVVDSANHRALLELARSRSLRLVTRSRRRSPYVDLSAGWEATFAGLPKKMRWTIRKSEKELLALGRLDYRPMHGTDTVAELLAAIYTIEAKSWKADSGTSIASQDAQRAFYEAMIPLAARSGILSAHLLTLDDRPIAFILGIDARDGVFLDLKESFDGTLAEHSPGHVLKQFAIPALIARGVTRYDFMGECDPYKMRWTNHTYDTVSLALFNRTWRGTLCYLRSRLAKSASTVR